MSVKGGFVNQTIHYYFHDDAVQKCEKLVSRQHVHAQ